MKKFLATVLFTAITVLYLSGCAKEEAQAKQDTSVEGLQKEKGIPVRISEIKRAELVQWDEYSGTLSGNEEISVFGLLGDNFAKVNVSVGDIVKKDDVLAEFSTDNPAANYNQAKIGFETAEKTYNRMKNVFESGGISRQQLDEVEAQYKIAEANFKAVKQLIKVISPASGVVVDVYFNKGDMNDPKKPFCKINKTEKLKTSIFIEEEKIAGYKKGQKVRVKWEGIRDREFSGVISRLSMSSNPAMRGFSAEILIDNDSDELMPGIFVYVYTPVYSKTDAIAIPRDSFFKEAGKEYVYIANGDLAEKREVKTGRDVGAEIEVLTGLNPGDKLISEGRSLLENGSKINIVN